MKTLEDYLQLHANDDPDETAVITPCGKITYTQLHKEVCKRAETFAATRGKPVAFRNTQDISFLTTYMGIHMAGGIAVPLEKDLPEDRRRAIETGLTDCEIPADVADILFTTGTTGKAKGVMISHQAILADAENLIDAHGYDSRLTFVICGPLNHIGSLSKIFPVIMCGASLYLLEGMKDLNAFFNAFDYPCTKMATFLVPASIRILITLYADRLKTYARKIDFIETGAAPITHQDMKTLSRLLPHSRLYNTYASTETGIISTYNFQDGRYIEGCLGFPMRHSRFQITSKGTIACSGATLTSGYANDPELTALTLRDHTFFTADYGRIDDEGRLHIAGREDDIINTGGMKVSPVEVESAALTFPTVTDCVCISVPHPIIGNALKLLVVMTDGADLDPKLLASHLRRTLENFKVPFYYEKVSSIRRTYNGKVDRKYYKVKLDNS